MRRYLFAAIAFCSCRGTDSIKESGTVETGDSPVDTQVEWADADGDGHTEDVDCDDADAAIHPEAEEVCDGLDNDCDGLADDEDEGVTGTWIWFPDVDGDGFGNAAGRLEACVAPAGYVADGTDCDDLNAAYNPWADESDCTDPEDYNCDGSVGFADVDGDGFAACQDCDDSTATSSPLGIEVCDGADNDCDGTADEDDAVDALTWYADGDADGYGDAAVSVSACLAPSAHVADDTDCDDTDSAVNEAATEICDSVDNDCDGWVDDTDPDLFGATTWYGDSDGDGYGGQQYEQAACSQPAGFVASSDDCDDLNAATYPGASEVCDLADNDCDADIDEGVENTWYEDSDADGYGNGSVSTAACTAPSGYVANALDCDDFSTATNPASYEVCDSVDNDCDGSIDEDAINASTWYQDNDADGYGSLAGTTISCDWLTGYADNPTDCDDLDAGVNPGATELCDTVDNDCDGSVDEGVTISFYEDTDSDGYGNPGSAADGCTAPGGYVSDATDCDDTEPNSFPGNPETCDGIDNDCANGVDEGVTTTFYEDADNDGYGNVTSTTDACTPPSGFVSDNSDCNDTDILIYPGASETCDGIDRDCDGILVSAGGQSQACAVTSCKAINDEGLSTGDGSYWLDPEGTGALELHCDMTSDGGGWTYVARGSNGSTQVNGAYGSVSLDPTSTGRWHLSANMIRGLVGNTTPYETYVTMGQNGDAHTPEIGEFRVRKETQAMTFESHMFEYSGWNGSTWVFRSSSGNSTDRGPSWEPDAANYCCHQDAISNWSNCRLAPLSAEGQWSNTNTNQHLRCASGSNVHDGLILFVR